MEVFLGDVVRYRPQELSQLASVTKFSRREIQHIYRGFKQVSPSSSNAFIGMGTTTIHSIFLLPWIIYFSRSRTYPVLTCVIFCYRNVHSVLWMKTGLSTYSHSSFHLEVSSLLAVWVFLQHLFDGHLPPFVGIPGQVYVLVKRSNCQLQTLIKEHNLGLRRKRWVRLIFWTGTTQPLKTPVLSWVQAL